MSKKLITTLNDDKDYTFSPLSVKQTSALRRSGLIDDDVDEEMEVFTSKMDKDEKLTKEEKKRFLELQDQQQDMMLEVLAVSLAKKHDEFKVNNPDGTTNQELKLKAIERVGDLIDLSELSRYFHFIMTAKLPKEEEEEGVLITEDGIIDLTNNAKSE